MLYRVLLVEAHKRGPARAHNLVKRERVLRTRDACQRVRRARHAAVQSADGASERRTRGAHQHNDARAPVHDITGRQQQEQRRRARPLKRECVHRLQENVR